MDHLGRRPWLLHHAITLPVLMAVTMGAQPALAGATTSPEKSNLAAAATFATRAESVQFVIDRAMSQLGVRYSWGGGDANGPTVGVRDDGAADAHGDYREPGFDCSGLMIYAFAPVIGYSLPHHSGTQYLAGPRFPLAEKMPGDMLFWSTSGRIYHVALYLGNEQVIEAPYSGSSVRVMPVRHGEIMPYVTRLL